MNKLRSIILAFTALTATVASAENMFATVLGKTEDETKEKIERNNKKNKQKRIIKEQRKRERELQIDSKTKNQIIKNQTK